MIIPWLSEEACARSFAVGNDPDAFDDSAKLLVVADWLDAVDVATGQPGGQMQAFLRDLAGRLDTVRDWATSEHGGIRTPAQVWPGLVDALRLEARS